jgi:anhydro-N-acetylmuramic acid kinase
VGGVANVTLWTGGDGIAAFDTGPGNGMIDQLVQARGAGRFDAGGALARAGQVSQGALAQLLDHPYFAAPPPKSLDRFDFSLDPLEGLGIEDAAATLVAFMAEAARAGFSALDVAPTEVIVCGGGRHNPAIMAALAQRLPGRVAAAEAHGWRGDAIEAEAFAYLAARTFRGLPISFPRTTGVAAPMVGGTVVRP